SRPEFMTAYTPYQPEVAQGTLQVMYEFQTHICRLTGMDVANGSMYDGATAAAEAAAMACRATRRNRVVVSETVNPLYRQVLQTYLSGRDTQLVTAPMASGLTDTDRLAEIVDDETACVIVGQPNFFGRLEDLTGMAETVHTVGGKLVACVDPIAQAILKTPADCGADIVVGEGQPLGIPMSFGGPLLGFFATRKELIRSLPGRVVARTTDVDGRDGFVLTLQTREQHIRREKATSNICTNQALCAAAAAVYMSLLGKSGLKQAALLSAERAQTVAQRLAELDGFELWFDGPFVREVAIKTPLPAARIIQELVTRNILPGIDAGRWYPGMENCLILATTEKRTEPEIDRLVSEMGKLASSHVVSRM
ncbi:MAG: aminomethyl-transferring glycine dehydrogenase subunit GcvPA, partial [candidate division Zixibacteria bacterium]|nr:aminomethyl-transferring glycine dehydrogenase subunit GcvPA [candidate division Zixibacteria bacterium]